MSTSSPPRLSDVNQVWVLAAVVLCYLAYYFLFVVKKPFVICGNPSLQDFVYTTVPILSEDYWPTVWCTQGKIHTIVRGICNKVLRKSQVVKFPYRREIIQTPDGGEIALDWADNNNHSNYTKDERPTVIIVPGLSGSSGEVYAICLVLAIQKMGYRTVVFNNRGLCGSKLKTPRTFCVINTEDLRTVVNHIRQECPLAKLFAIGASAGGINLFHYLADYGKDCHLSGAMIISVLYDMFESTKVLEAFPNVIFFNQTIIKDLYHRLILPNEHILRTNDNLDVNNILQARTVRQYHTRLTVPMFGHSDWKQFYRDCNLTGRMHKIQVPTLFMNAADDPFTPIHSIPIEEMKKEDNILLVLTSHGGHCGFMDNVIPSASGYSCKVFTQFVDAIFKHYDTDKNLNRDQNLNNKVFPDAQSSNDT